MPRPVVPRPVFIGGQDRRDQRPEPERPLQDVQLRGEAGTGQITLGIKMPPLTGSVSQDAISYRLFAQKVNRNLKRLGLEKHTRTVQREVELQFLYLSHNHSLQSNLIAVRQK